jgi:DNA-binding GntR family transcriptional regulator
MSVVTTLVPVDRVLLRDVAVARLRDAIVSGEIPPGTVVKDADLAARMGLSVAPVRAALARLTDEGLVESKPQSRTRVTPLVLRQVRDAAVVVGAMHEVATREAVPRVTADDLAAMREANSVFAAALDGGDLDGALAADDRLHAVLLERCGNTAVTATVDRFTPLVRRLERQRFGAPGHPSVDLHDRLIAACAARDVEAAVATTTEIWTALLSGLTEESTDGPVRLP